MTNYINQHYVRRAIDEEKGWMNANDAYSGRTGPARQANRISEQSLELKL